MHLPYSKTVYSEEETISLAAKFSLLLKPGNVVALNGNLGAGKTFFIKHLLKEFGIEGVSSPTFAIVNQFVGIIKVNHFDFYRINRINELYDIGFEDYLNMDDSVTMIEWANLVPEILPKRLIEINIEILGDTERKFTIKKME
ncbi:MAG: tRNA (adenosine(37)-N6)-threonylcarbamoyltransferase complex ATPase subunit type 1 TsaE [Ignavibacteriales bacterium]|nr:tRNA (adenosine(37)-N6)-threonylcarbamoyltransferase complex ATPase subunit type 1 TsaE [Ignavibacteriales bacterium]